MKKLLTFLTLLTLFFTTALAAQETYTFSDHYSSNTVLDGVTVNATNFSMTFNKNGGNAPQYYTTGTAVRWYAKNKMTISSTNTITAITFTFGSDDGTNKITADVGTYSNGSWSGSATSVVFTVGGTSKNRRLAAVTVTYTPSTLETCATPTFSPEPGTYYESQSVSISSTDGATIRYTTDGTEPTASTGTVYNGSITVDETTTIKAIATKQGYNNSSVGTALYLISEPVANGKATFNAVNDRGTGSITKSPITFACSNGVLNNGSEYRLYKNSTTTFSVEDGYTITKIEFFGTESNPASGFGETSGLTTEGYDGTWIGEAQSIDFTATDNQVRATLINVYFVESSTITVGVPSISFDEWTSGDITVDATITPGTNATATLYKIGEDGTYATYTDPIEIDLTEEASPITIYAKSTNGDNESSEVHETFTLPALAVSINPSSYSGTEAQSVEISATNVVGRAALTYKINDGTVENYSDAISLSTPGTYTITAYASDDRADGEQVSATATITINEQQAGTLTATFVAGTDKGSTTSNGTPDEMSKGNPLVTVYGSDAAFATAEYRLYQGSKTTISVPAGSKITKIVFTCTASGTDKYGPGNLTTESGYTYSGYVGTWEGEAQSVTFGAPSKQVRCTTIDVTYIAGETQETADYYLVGTFNMDGNNWVQIDPLYKFEDNHDGTYSLNGKDMPDNVQFKIIKVVDNNITWYGGSVGDGNPYGLHGGWHTNIPLKDTPDYNQSIQNFKMEVGGESNFTIHASTTPMTLDVEKTKLYLRKSTDNWANHEMTPVNGGGWTLAEESFDADAQFHIVDGWNVQRGTSQTEGDNLYWIYQSATDIQCGLDQNKPNFKIVTAGDYTLTVNSALTQLTVHCILPTYEARIASNITGGTVAFNASGSTTPLELTENTEVRVYVTPQTSEWELATLTYTVTNSSPVSFIDNYNNDGGYYYFLMPAGDVVINATFTWQGGEVTETTYALVTSNSDIEVGAKYIIVNEENSKALVKAYQSQGIDIDNHTTTITNALGIAEFVLGNGTDEGTYTFKYKDNYLYNSSGTSLDITGTSSTNNNWTISIGGADDYFATITSSNNRLIHFLASANNYQGDFRAYSNSQNSSNVQLYKEVSAPVEATLADIEAPANDENVNTKYAITDPYLVAVVSRDVVDGDQSYVYVWCKDNKNVVTPITVPEGAVDFMRNNGAQIDDQSNWVVLRFDGTDSNAHGLVGYQVTNIVGTYVDATNYMIDVESYDKGEEDPYTPNVYCVANFNPTYIANGGIANQPNDDKNYFFMPPKVQEYCKITFAEWNGTTFSVPEASGFEGTLSLGWDYNESANGNPLTQLQVETYLNEANVINPETGKYPAYHFNAIVQRPTTGTGAKGAISGGSIVQPMNLEGSENSILTAISTILAGNGEVKSVKYVNVAGMVSDVPFQGVNIVVTEYTDGSRTTTKMLKK